MNALRQFWAQLAPRDQRVLLVGGVALAVIALWLLAWEPLRAARDAARVRVAASTTDLALMQAAAPRLRELGANSATRAADGRSLLAQVDATARSSDIGRNLLRVEPVGEGQVRVYFEAAAFDALVQWLETLEQQSGTRLAELSVQRAAGNGQVDARLLLERGRGAGS